MRRVLECRARGLSYKETAAELGISLGTVRCHLQRIFSRLGVRSSLAAVLRVRGD